MSTRPGLFWPVIPQRFDRGGDSLTDLLAVLAFLLGDPLKIDHGYNLVVVQRHRIYHDVVRLPSPVTGLAGAFLLAMVIVSFQQRIHHSKRGMRPLATAPYLDV